MIKDNNAENTIVFCDFDGTITKEDTVDKFLQIYANSEWLDIEKSWEAGSIGSKECLNRQIGCIKNVTENQIEEFIETIEIDDYFISFVNELQKLSIPICVVSDGFDWFIKKVFKKYEISNITVFSNNLVLEDNKLITIFPYNNPECEAQAGLCKCKILKTYGDKKNILYIGDGRSDMCASKHANMLFAKGKLAKYCEEKGISFNQFVHFGQIVDEFVLRKEDYLDKDRIIVG